MSFSKFGNYRYTLRDSARRGLSRNTAMLQRIAKEKTPENFCPVASCLYRILNGQTGEQGEVYRYRENSREDIMSAAPVKGLRFLHTRVVDYDKKPALYQVTRIAMGVVYYRPVYDAGIQGSERLGTVECCDLDTFKRVRLGTE
jgi:hypothetical protein